MKKIILSLMGAGALALASCSDMLEVDSKRSLVEPDINGVTDSLYYAWGIMEAMQQAADQYVLQNEMRGEQMTVNATSGKDLRELANFTATTTNKYDSAYVYYKVINNCNYYIAKRDTSIYDGSYNLTTQEMAAVHAFRAWAYLQLARQYGKVKFYTTPLTSISQIEGDNSPEYDIDQICAALAPSMEQYTGVSVPSYSNISAGYTNRGTSKVYQSKQMYIPVDVILGELYLEAGRWSEAAQHYFRYLTDNKVNSDELMSAYSRAFEMSTTKLPAGALINSGGSSSWANSLTSTASTGIISYIPMAPNRINGRVTSLPKLFGYNYYSSTSDRDSLYGSREIEPSQAYIALSDSSNYYYYNQLSTSNYEQTKYSYVSQFGDSRRYGNVEEATVGDSTVTYPVTYTEANIVLFRGTTIWLHLAEALNRMGYTDAAFAILKDGLKTGLPYISEETTEYLTTTLPFFAPAYAEIFSGDGNENYGIHLHGSSDSKGVVGIYSKYQMDTVVVNKQLELQRIFPDAGFVAPEGETAAERFANMSKEAKINAMEDLLCDEYALEFAYDGVRFSDLMRLARNKNRAGLYGANFGNRWLSQKYESTRPSVAALLLDQNNWYLPMK